MTRENYKTIRLQIVWRSAYFYSLSSIYTLQPTGVFVVCLLFLFYNFLTKAGKKNLFADFPST